MNHKYLNILFGILAGILSGLFIACFVTISPTWYAICAITVLILLSNYCSTELDFLIALVLVKLKLQRSEWIEYTLMFTFGLIFPMTVAVVSWQIFLKFIARLDKNFPKM
jgi:hypothetical protein